MTEYDYSEEGYVAFQKQQAGVGKWARQVDKHRADFQNPFVPTPSEVGRVSEYQRPPHAVNINNTRTLSRPSGSIVNSSSRKARHDLHGGLPGPAPLLPGPAPVEEYQRARSMSQNVLPVPLAARQYQPAPHPAYHHTRQPPVIPAPADHRSSSHSRHSSHSHASRPPSRTDDGNRASRVMYYAHAPGNSPHAKGVYASYMLPNTRIIQLPKPRANETFHMLAPAPHKRYELMEPSSKTMHHALHHDENHNGRRTAPPRDSVTHDARQREAQAGLLKRFFGGIVGGNNNHEPRPRSTTPHPQDSTRRPLSRAHTPGPDTVPPKRLRRKSFF